MQQTHSDGVGGFPPRVFPVAEPGRNFGRNQVIQSTTRQSRPQLMQTDPQDQRRIAGDHRSSSASVSRNAPASADKVVYDANQRSSRAAVSWGRPKVCFIGLSNLTVLAPDLDPRGAAGEPVQQTLLAKAFARRGYDVSMITADCGQPDGEMVEGIRVLKAYAPNAGIRVLRFVHPRFTGLWSALKRADADVYYVSCAGAIVGQVALFCRRHGKRFVYRVASDADCAPDTLLIQYWRDKRLYEYGLRRARGVLAQSEKQQDLLRRNYDVRSVVAGLLVERPSMVAEFPDRDVDALWVSNIRPLKRPDLLFSLAEAVPEISFHMAGGPVAADAQSFVDAQRRAAGVRNVTFHGPVPYRAVSALYGRSKVFVNTSDIEGFPNTYLQAWASGVPVIAFFDPDGLIGKEGLGIAVTTHAQMVDAVRALTRSPSSWNQASARCLRFIERVYGEDRVVQPYMQLLDRAAQSYM